MQSQPASMRRASRRRKRLRRIGSIVSIALIACAVILFNGIGITSDGSHEWLNGQSDTHSVLLPLALFLLGAVGLASCLP